MSDQRPQLSIAEVNEIIIPEQSIEYCLSLFYILKETYPPLLYPETDLDPSIFWAREEYVRAFLHTGGFLKKYEMGMEEQIAEQEKAQLNLEKLKYDVKNARRIFKTYWWTFGLSILGVALALGKIAFDTLTK